MRTTVTLETDVARMLRDAAHRSKRSFKATLNAALRVGLDGRTSGGKASPFVVKARPMGLRAGLDPAGFNRLADELEAEEFTARPRRRKSA